MKRNDVAIVGGGIIGLMSAYYLSKEGAKVTLIDKGPEKQASSHANCGLISPSHILPLNSLSLIIKSFGFLLKKDAPFTIKPQADWQFFSWLLGFLRKSLPAAVYSSSKGRMELLLSSASLYQELLKEENIECDWSNRGILFVFKSKKAFRDYAVTDDYTRKFGIGAEKLEGKQLTEKEPALRDDVYGAWYYDIDNWLKPDELIKGLKSKLKNRGVDIITGTEVIDFQTDKLKVRALLTKEKEEIHADQYLLSSGAWSPLLAKKIGVRLPVIPGKGYSITMERPENTPSLPCNLMEKKVVATPWQGSYRLGSTMELAGYDESLNRTRLEALKKGAIDYLKTPYTSQVLEEWWGWRPMTYDGLPIIDKSPKHENLWLATGHSMLGMSMGTGTGKLISEMMLQKEPHVDTSPYSHQRFGKFF